MAKGHLIITEPPTRSKNEDEPPARKSCFRQLTITDLAILLAGIQLALLAGYLLYLTTGHDAISYTDSIKRRVSIFMIIDTIMIFVVMLLVFGIVGKRLWMIVPSILAELLFVVAFIYFAIYFGNIISNHQTPVDASPHIRRQAEGKLQELKCLMIWSIVGAVISLLSLVVQVPCFISVYKNRNAAVSKEKHQNGY